jgi:uracil-DNA glycosylase family 4
VNKPSRINVSAKQIAKNSSWDLLNRQITRCEQCPRLRSYCQQIAEQKRAAFQGWNYWGQPVPNFGDPQARLLIVGLAPAAHGANRTGRMFTGDRSGEWLYRALAKTGFANQPTSVSANDGLRLTDCAITAICHCAPPQNKPTPTEIANCRTWFEQTVNLLPARVIVALGQIAWQGIVTESKRLGWLEGPRPKFGHGATVTLAGERWLVGSYHPSQQNTFTGKLTEPMLDNVFAIARQLIGREQGR